MKFTRPCPRPDSASGANANPVLSPFFRWALTATAAAALVACGGGGGGGESTTPANQAPTVAINAPAASAAFTEGEAIHIAATAADSDGTVVRVEFYDGTTKIGEATAAPFELMWTGASAGAHTITVRAIDNSGAVALSGSVALSVTAAVPAPPPPPPAPPPPPPPANEPPTVGITSPANNFKTNAPGTVTLVANAADADGSVAKVEFFRIDPAAPVYDASTLIGAAVTAPPFEQQVAALAAGTYSFVARATDNLGLVTTSSSVQVVVNALPTVSITTPAPGATVLLGTTVTLRASATDADGSIAKVEFFLDGSTTPLGLAARVGTTSNYDLPWTNATVGAHTITARATDNDGAVQTTASVSVNVPANVLPTVTLDVPVAGTNAPAAMTLTASASDSDGSVTKVEFFDGTTLLGQGTFDAATSKYRLVLANRPAGTYVITARATDNLGATQTTASRSVVIAPNVPPTVAITSAASFNLPAAVVLTATAADTDGIAKVEFFNGATKLGEATTAPYQFTWAGATAGSFTITARATDTVGSVTTSAPQALVVNPNTAGNWDTLNAAQKAGLTMVPDRPIEAGGVDAGEVMTAIGTNTVIPKWVTAMAQAAKSLALFQPGLATGEIACPGGGMRKVENGPTATSRTYSFDDCVVGGFTFYGGGSLAPFIQRNVTVTPPVDVPIGAQAIYTELSATSYRLVLEGVVVTGNGAPVITPLVPPAPHSGSGEAYPRGAFTYTTVTCTVAGGTTSCLTNLDVSFLYGNDLAWSGFSDAGTPAATDDTYVLNGTARAHHCPPDPTLPNEGRDACLAAPPAARHIRFESMTNTGGRAIVYGNNGYSVVTRMAPVSPGVERMSVQRNLSAAVTVGGVTYPVGLGPVEIYRCAVGAASGDWACTLEIAP